MSTSRRDRHSGRLRVGRGALFGALVILVLSITMGLNQRAEFDEKIWKDREQIHKAPYPRQAMADDLMYRGLLDNLKRDAVEGLLGPSERRWDGYDLVYWLGPERGYIPIDSEWLAIKLGPDERVVHCELTTD